MGNGEPGAFTHELVRLHAAGYEIRILLVDAPPEVLLERNEGRRADEGRYIDPELLGKLAASVARTFDEWRGSPVVEKWQLYSTAATD